jgi:hypothetical protein
MTTHTLKSDKKSLPVSPVAFYVCICVLYKRIVCIYRDKLCDCMCVLYLCVSCAREAIPKACCIAPLIRFHE